MKFNLDSFTCIRILILLYAPVSLVAQSGREGNHCAVQKSPYRVSMDSGKVVYLKQCLSCHQSDGLGVSNVNPPLNVKIVNGDKTKLIGIIINGQNTHEELNGKIYQDTMPANPEIRDQEIANVLTYVRNSFGNKASAVKESEVKSARSKLK